jgi:hypothetical protein
MLQSIWLFMRAIAFVVCHPFDILYLTVVRRYVDAQGNYIGELYEGTDRDAKMIGASCDNWPLNADQCPLPANPRVCWKEQFTATLPANTLRVGAWEAIDNAKVQAHISIRRFCILRVAVLNRFVERVLGETYEH